MVSMKLLRKLLRNCSTSKILILEINRLYGYAYWHCSNFVPIMLDIMLLHLVVLHSLIQKPT